MCAPGSHSRLPGHSPTPREAQGPSPLRTWGEGGCRGALILPETSHFEEWHTGPPPCRWQALGAVRAGGVTILWLWVAASPPPPTQGISQECPQSATQGLSPFWANDRPLAPCLGSAPTGSPPTQPTLTCCFLKPHQGLLPTQSQDSWLSQPPPHPGQGCPRHSPPPTFQAGCRAKTSPSPSWRKTQPLKATLARDASSPSAGAKVCAREAEARVRSGQTPPHPALH